MTKDLDREIGGYDFKTSEQYWQDTWTESKIFETDRNEMTKYFINFPFPYINGAPHLGHGYSLMKAEIMARYQRMLGKNVLFPFAFHATGEPIAGVAKRVRNKDLQQIQSLKLSGVSDGDIEKFDNPEYIVTYFRQKWTETVKGLGAAVDWRRQFVTTELTPVFSKFIEWQYRKLKADGYVIQGSHPVIWCPADQNPTGDHDRLEGVGARVVDFVLLKFKSEKHNAYFLPATLRPETVYGVTNMFVHPDAEYVKIKVEQEYYIISKQTVIKFEDQQHDISEIVDIPVEDIIGSITINPVTGNEVIVLPGEFIDPEGSTGVVMSVPGHAPMDWIALINLKENVDELSKWGITSDDMDKVQPISLIKVEGYGEFPAGEEIESRKIKSMTEPAVKEATKMIYRKEHSHGILKEITGKYQGKKVSEVKDLITQDFIDENISFILKEPGDMVVCRCGTRNHVKYLENQWFLKFGDKAWKEKTYELLDSMTIFPEEGRSAFRNTIDWFENKACARKSGLGTKLPWDKNWIVETLSDSVIYMVYYLISKYVNSGEFTIDYAVDDIFNYLILGKGNKKSLSTKYGISEDLLTTIRDDIDYFYGFDLRTSGKDLINNHLSFMLMHHTAIFPKKYWPKGMAVNGYVTIIKPGSTEAQKMSKSKGVFQTIEDAISEFGVDATRLGFAVAGEGLKDAQFSLAEGVSYIKWIQNIYSMAFEEIDDEEKLSIDRWLYSNIQQKIRDANESLSKMETRSAFQTAYHEVQNALRWYIRRRGSKGPAYRYAIETSIRMVTPFVPHVVEEIWKEWNKEGFATNNSYPKVDESLIDIKAENGEKILSSFMDDLTGLISFLKDKGNPDPTKIEVFISPEWKYSVYNQACDGLDNLIKRVMEDPEMRKLGKPVPAYCLSLMKAGGPPDIPWNFQQEWDIINEAQSYIERITGTKVRINDASPSTHPKAKAAVPRRPGINLITE